jgi:hypothetical protein
MKKSFQNTLILLFCLFGCASGPDLDGFEPYVNEREIPWHEKLEVFYGQSLDLQVTFYKGPAKLVHKRCKDAEHIADACTYDSGEILMLDTAPEDCNLGLHEMMHHAMVEVYGDSDPHHYREDWQKIVLMCFRVVVK